MTWCLLTALCCCLVYGVVSGASYNTSGGGMGVAELFHARNTEDSSLTVLSAVIVDDQPPPHQKTAEMARFIVHEVDWTAIATLSTRPQLAGRPFASVFSVSDGTVRRSSGVPYMYLSSLDVSVKDLAADNRASLSMSLAQTDYCHTRHYDPESPLCAHVVLSGRVVRVPAAGSEHVFARRALFSRHPEMRRWPVNHHFFIAKLAIEQICLLDYFGGIIDVPVSDYFNVNVSTGYFSDWTIEQNIVELVR